MDTLPFTFFDGARPPLITRISPQGVPLESHTQVPRSVLVHGSNFAPNDLGCEIDGVVTTATFIRASLVRCATPLHPPDAPASLELRVVRISLYLPISPYICLYLPISPYISLCLPNPDPNLTLTPTLAVPLPLPNQVRGGSHVAGGLASGPLTLTLTLTLTP